MKKGIILLMVFTLVMGIIGCGGSGITAKKDRKLNIEMRRDDTKAINDPITIIVKKGENRKTYTTNGQNYTLALTETLPVILEFIYTDDFLPVTVDINEDYFPDNGDIGELSVLLPIKKTLPKYLT